ncbi:DNA alkylation repair protein [Parasediminibacterium sp. JCM 36343]|uniref:DNA alkylation repair protein n=1 Tax=Parasediminibacterium sp. JCM 36343 TaxID=3374279 RepID=UPI003977EFA4
MNTIDLFIASLQTLFVEKTDAAVAASSKAYLKGQFGFIGMRTQDRRALTKMLLQEKALPNLEAVTTIVQTLWQMPEREYHHAAIQILAHYKKYWRPNTLSLMEQCLTTHSWWDSVDNLNAECISEYFRLFPAALGTTTYWNKHDNMWLQRSSLIFQKAYKQRTDTDLLAQHILYLAASKEFFIQKAIGWALREYSKTNPDWVTDFVASNPLPALSKREAMRRIGW